MTAYVIGEEQAVLGFGLIGVPGSAPTNREEALHAFAAATRPGEPHLLLITEAVAEWIADEIHEAVLGGKMVQVIPGMRAAREQRQDSQALLLSALGIKL